MAAPKKKVRTRRRERKNIEKGSRAYQLQL